jgi:hypothetical protein
MAVSGKSVGRSILTSALLGPTDRASIGKSVITSIGMDKLFGGRGGRSRIDRAPEVKEARQLKRASIKEARPMGPAAVKIARQEGRASMQEARGVARERIKEEKAAKQTFKDVPAVTPKRPTKMFKEGGSVMKPKMKMVMKGGKKVPAFAADGVGKMKKGGMTDKEGRALGRKTADARGRAMKKGK